ncbi:hypothetical protein DV515_00014425, partial [Chloebia gouldiae]
MHKHFPPIWDEEIQPIVPKISCRAKRTRRRRQQRFVTICRAPAHIIPVNSSHKDPNGLQNWDLGEQWGMQSRAG